MGREERAPCGDADENVALVGEVLLHEGGDELVVVLDVLDDVEEREELEASLWTFADEV